MSCARSSGERGRGISWMNDRTRERRRPRDSNISAAPRSVVHSNVPGTSTFGSSEDDKDRRQSASIALQDFVWRSREREIRRVAFGSAVNRPQPDDRTGLVRTKSSAMRGCAIERKGHEAAHRRKMAASSGEFSRISSSRPMIPFCLAQNADSGLMPRASPCVA